MMVNVSQYYLILWFLMRQMAEILCVLFVYNEELWPALFIENSTNNIKFQTYVVAILGVSQTALMLSYSYERAKKEEESLWRLDQKS